VNNQTTQVLIAYTIESLDDIQSIACTINPGSFNVPSWLQIRKFELKSIKSDEGYMPLFSDNGNIKNMDAVLFIDKTYDAIMQKEKFKIVVTLYYLMA
jgi:hypothetical protein